MPKLPEMTIDPSEWRRPRMIAVGVNSEKVTRIRNREIESKDGFAGSHILSVLDSPGLGALFSRRRTVNSRSLAVVSPARAGSSPLINLGLANAPHLARNGSFLFGRSQTMAATTMGEA